MNKGLKWGIFFGLLVIIAVIAGWYATPYIDQRLERRVGNYIEELGTERAELKIDSINVRWWKRSIELKNMQIRPIHQDTGTLHLTVEKLSASSIGILSYMTKGRLHIGKLTASRPNVRYTAGDEGFRLSDFNMFASTDKIKYSPVHIRNIELKGGTLEWIKKEGDVKLRVQGIDLMLKGKNIEQEAERSAIYLPYSDGAVSWDSLLYRFPKGLYWATVGKGRCSTRQQNCRWNRIRLIPQLPRHSFSQFTGYESNRLDLFVERAGVDRLMFEQLRRGRVNAGKLWLKGARLEVFRDKQWPEKKEEKSLPHMQLKRLPIPLELDTVSIRHSRVKYTEFNDDLSGSGYVVFNNIDAQLRDLTNRESVIEEGHTIPLTVEAWVMKAGKLELDVRFPMHKDGYHTIVGQLGRMDMRRLNPAFVPLKKMRVRSGVIDSMNFSMQMGRDVSDGQLKVAYHDLKIELLKPGDEEEVETRNILSFLANTLKIKSDNKKPLRVGEVSFRRIKHKSMFNYWWKSLASGLEGSLGL